VPVGVQNANDLVRVPDGDAEGRPDALVDEAVRGVMIGARSVDEYGEVPFEGHRYDRPADLDLVAPAGTAPDPRRARLEPALGLEHDHALIHGHVTVDEVEDVLEKVLERLVGDQGLSDLDDDLEGAVRVADILLDGERGRSCRSLGGTPDDRPEEYRGGGVRLRYGSVDEPDPRHPRPVESHRRVADADLVPRDERLGSIDLAIVDERAVLAGRVADGEAVPGPLDERVT
jgi:hypothetical protein